MKRALALALAAAGCVQLDYRTTVTTEPADARIDVYNGLGWSHGRASPARLVLSRHTDAVQGDTLMSVVARKEGYEVEAREFRLAETPERIHLVLRRRAAEAEPAEGLGVLEVLGAPGDVFYLDGREERGLPGRLELEPREYLLEAVRADGTRYQQPVRVTEGGVNPIALPPLGK